MSKPEFPGLLEAIQDYKKQLRTEFGFSDPSEPAAAPPKATPKAGPAWSEIDKQLDPNMPSAERDKIRQKYFLDVIRPKIQEGYSVQKTYDEFLKRTERPLDVRAREMGEKIGQFAGDMVAQGAELAAISAVTGPLIAAGGRSLLGASKAVDVATKIARGGTAFGIYDALHAKDGDRVNAGLRGAAIGAAFETGLGAVFGFSEKKIADSTAEAINNKSLVNPKAPEWIPTPQADIPPGQPSQLLLPESVEMGAKRLGVARGSGGKMRGLWEAPGAIAEGMAAQTKKAEELGFTMGPAVETPKRPGLWATIKTADGKPTEIRVPRGTESEAIGVIEDALSKGGTLDGITYHPASRARFGELMRHFADKAADEDQAFTMRTAPGKADRVATELNKMGLRGTWLDASTVRVGPKAPWVLAQEAKQIGERIAKAPEISKTVEGDLEKKAYRVGEIRSLIQAGQGNRALHAELHHVQGEIGAMTGIQNRADIGKLGLRFFERRTEGAEADFQNMVDKYKGPRGEVGEKPPVGNKAPTPGILKGYRKVPASEDFKWDAEDRELFDAPGEVRVRPTGRTKRMPGKADEFAGAMIRTPDGPIRILTDLNRGTIYHESIHDGINHAGLDNEAFKNLIDKQHRPTATGIMQDLVRSSPEHYKDNQFHQLANEAFTYSAEAIRMNDEESLAAIARADTSEAHVKDFVNSTSKNILEASYKSQGAPVRALQRRMNDLIRRTDPMRTAALQRASLHGFNTWFNPELGQWVMRDGEGREIFKKSLDDVWDHIDGIDPSEHFPDIAGGAYFKGLRGPMVPSGMEPVEGPVTLETDAIPPLGWQAIRSIFQPTLDWASSVQTKLGKFGVDLDFYGAVKAVDDAGRLAGPEMDRVSKTWRTILEGVPGARRSDYGEVLRLPESQWGAMVDKLGLSGSDVANIRELAAWDRENVAKGGLSLVDTLNTMHQVREVGGDLSRLGGVKTPATEAIRTGSLGYEDMHVGQAAAWVTRKSIGKRFLDEPLKALETLAQTKNAHGTPVLDPIRWPIRNYINYMRGIPDASQQIMNDWIGGMQNFAVQRAKQLNQSLPEGLKIPENFGTPRELMSKYQLLLYTAGLGARPAVFIRDTFQSLYALAVMGPSTFAEGMTKALTRAGQAEAREAGALIHGRNVGEFFGDVSGDLPATGRVSDYAVKAADALLSPSRIGHNVGRSIAYLGEKSRALREIARFRAGEITDPEELAKRTGVWFQDQAPKSRLLAMAADPAVPLDEAAKQFGLAMNDATQFALRSGTQGAGLRTGMGRVFGQYGTWPMNYIELLRKLVSRTVDTPTKGVPALGMWMAMNYGAFQAASSLGIDASKWLFFSPAGYAGSPNLELLQHIMEAPEESATGLEARRKLHDVPFEFMPMGVEIQSILKSIEDEDYNVPRMLGFRPLKEQDAVDFEQWVATETGFSR